MFHLQLRTTTLLMVQRIWLAPAVTTACNEAEEQGLSLLSSQSLAGGHIPFDFRWTGVLPDSVTSKHVTICGRCHWLCQRVSYAFCAGHLNHRVSMVTLWLVKRQLGWPLHRQSNRTLYNPGASVHGGNCDFSQSMTYLRYGLGRIQGMLHSQEIFPRQYRIPRLK